MTIGMNVYVRNTTNNRWKKQILTIEKKKNLFILLSLQS